MLDLLDLTNKYLDFCKYQKNLNDKTLKAYRIDLYQFIEHLQASSHEPSRLDITDYTTELNKKYKPKSAKRKVASLKAFIMFLSLLPCYAFNFSKA